MSNNKPFDQFVMVNICFSAYSGGISLKKTSLANNTLPSELSSSGDLKLINPKRLTAFNTLRANARIACLKYGTSFAGGYAVPVAKWADTKELLDKLKDSFEKEARNFVDDYHSYVEEWASHCEEKYPGKGKVIRDAQHDASWLRGRFNASYLATFVQPIEGTEDDATNLVGGMYESVISDVSAAAKQAVKGHEKGSQITRRMVTGTLQDLLDKLKGLAFVSSSIQSLHDVIEDYLAKILIPASGHLDKAEQQKIVFLLYALSDPDSIDNIGAVLSPVTKEPEPQPIQEVVSDEDEDDFFFIQ